MFLFDKEVAEKYGRVAGFKSNFTGFGDNDVMDLGLGPNILGAPFSYATCIKNPKLSCVKIPGPVLTG